ncbi:MAG: hypothetical protein WBG70_09115 [Spirulinaceae cyanobacterium]
MKNQNLPKQSAPVIRHSSSATISGDQQGVEASSAFDWLKNKALGALAGAINA